ncbi:MAG: hypothetical protein M3145_08790 [Pseudomonadota bacterium]|nr:hypothetical protein [Pseudomonadota bacterium]
MGQGLVTPPPSGASHKWGLTPEQWSETQGIVVSGFGHLPWAEALFLRLDRPGGAWLNTLRTLAPITDATGKTDRASAIAFTWTGLERLGLDKETLETFSLPFREGMHQEDRRRRLGDQDKTGMLIEGGPLWSGNTPATVDGSVVLSTRETVHALLLLYDKDEGTLDSWAAQVCAALQKERVTRVHRLRLDLRLDENEIAREHFGFADGISQPMPYLARPDGTPVEKDPWHGVPVGEILMGYRNAHDEDAPGPVVRKAGNPATEGSGLWPDGAPEGFLNLGLNGTYMVVRELRQDVAAFWTSLDKGAAAVGEPKVDADWLAARIIGRDRDGNLLCPSGTLAPKDGRPDDAFGFLRTDPHGLGCPLGSHVRRANPRDGLAPDEASRQALLDSANNHRILRRGRKYGPTIQDPRRDDGEDRGLLFICLNTDIARQFEFIQQTWLLNRNFATLFDETDPLLGPKGPLTIPKDPLRRIVEVETYVRMAGGEYFFLPSLPALAYLARLPGQADPPAP